jgi:hypothetical protein
MITSPSSATQGGACKFEKRIEADQVGDLVSNKSMRDASTASSRRSEGPVAPSFWRFRNEDGSHPGD